MTDAQMLADAYVATIGRFANGCPEYVHPTYGRSHHIMRRLRQLVGEAECDRLIFAALGKQAGLKGYEKL